VLSADGKGVPLREPADAPVIAPNDHARGPKPGRQKMGGCSVASPNQIDPYVRTPLAVVEVLFRDPAAPPEQRAPHRPVPSRIGCARCCRWPPPWPMPWRQRARQAVGFPLAGGRSPPARSALPTPLGVLMDGQARCGRPPRRLGRDPAGRDCSICCTPTGYLVGSGASLSRPGSDLALKWMKVLVCGVAERDGEPRVDSAGCNTSRAKASYPPPPAPAWSKFMAISTNIGDPHPLRSVPRAGYPITSA